MCIKALMVEIARIKATMIQDKATDYLDSRVIPHRDQIHNDLQNFKAYHLWGCDKNVQCLVGTGANRIESIVILIGRSPLVSFEYMLNFYNHCEC